MIRVLQGWHHPEKGKASRETEQAPPGLAKFLAVPEESRESVLGLLRTRMQLFPYRAVHPTWFFEVLPSDPLLRSWTLDLLPPDVRERLLEFLPEDDGIPGVWVTSTPPPVWFERWWRHYLGVRFRDLVPLPGETVPSSPLTFLGAMKEKDMIRTLRLFGLRGMAAVASRSDAKEVVRLVYSLEPEFQPLLVRYVREKIFRQPEFWREVYEAVRPDLRSPNQTPLYLGLADVARVIRTRGLKREYHRLKFRLPKSLGMTFARYHDAEWAATPPENDAEWDEHLQHDLAFLLKKGLIATPRPEEYVPL